MTEAAFPLTRAWVRVVTAVGVGVVAGAVTARFAPWQAAVLVGWDLSAAVYATWIWVTVLRLDPDATRSHATRVDESRAVTDLILLTASVFSLAGVGLAVAKGTTEHGGAEVLLLAVGVAAVILSWAVLHTVFTLRYARLYFDSDRPAIDFNEDNLVPDYHDFAYVAFTIGMTYQVSDTNLVSKAIRRTALRQALLSYLFGTVIIAMTINLVAGIVH